MTKRTSILTLMAAFGTLFLCISAAWAAPKISSSNASAVSAQEEFKAIQMTAIQPIINSIGTNDSYIVLTGKIDMGGADYYEAVPKMHTEVWSNWQCEDVVSYYIPQKKSNEAAGYKYVWVFKGTGTIPTCWEAFKDMTEFKCVTQYKMRVKKTAASDYESWDITSPNPIKHEYTLGPVQSK